MKSTNHFIFSSFIFFFAYIHLSAQRPVVDIGGHLELYDNLDTSSIFIGLGAGQNTNATPRSNVTFIGAHAGQSNTSGKENTFVGFNSGALNLGGSDNSFFGAHSGKSNTWGFRNSMFGSYAGAEITSGTNNSFFGAFAGEKNTVGLRNSFFGSYAGHQNDEGEFNSFFGSSTGISNTLGSRNVFVGSESGFRNATGDDNVFVGGSSGSNNINGMDNTYIGAAAGFSIEGQQNTIIGSQAGAVIDFGNRNIIIGSDAGPSFPQTESYNRLYIDVQRQNDPLIYGEFDNDLIKINGKLDVGDGIYTNLLSVDSASIQLQNLGQTNDKGITWAAFTDVNFALILESQIDVSSQKLHFRKYQGTEENIMTLSTNGNVGIGQEYAQVPLHIGGGVDATTSTGGFLILGNTDGLNTVVDNNEIMARNNSSTAALNLNINGGDVRLGGKIRILDDVTTAEKGQIRFNSTTNNFEGYDGSTWLSLTNKKDQTLFLGPGSFYSDDSDITQALGFDLFNGVTKNDGSGNEDKRRIVPIQLPVGSTIKQIAYFFKEDLMDMSLNMKLVKYDLTDNNKSNAGFEYNTELNNTFFGWSSTNEFGTEVIEANYFYAVQFYSTGTSSPDHEDLLQYKGIRLVYTLP